MYYGKEYAERIRSLRAETNLSNSGIANKLGCSKRTVRRYANSDKPARRIYKRKRGKILLFDIETAPMEVYVWGLIDKRNRYISPENVIKDWSVLSWAAKWLFEPDIISDVATPEEAENRDDARIIERIWNLFEKADIIVAHNAYKFDVRRLNARFIINDLGPNTPYRVIDTLKEARKVFDFPSYKLDALNERFGLSKKIETNFQLWIRCVTGGKKALKEMQTYNKSDVVALEELYLALRPWIKSHPPMSLYHDVIDAERCPTCESEKLSWNGFYATPAGKYKSFRCDKCGAIGRSRYSWLEKEERENLVISTAR